MKKKTPFQLQALEKFYEERKNPTREEINDVAEVLELTYRQVRDWFRDRRRRENGLREAVVSPEEFIDQHRDDRSTGKVSHDRGRHMPAQNLASSRYIMCKVFRKDGPPLGVEFDTLPSLRFRKHNGSEVCHTSYQGNQETNKRKMVPEDVNDGCMPLPKHGMGKGLMTVWRATNPAGGDSPRGVSNRHLLTKNNFQASKITVRNAKHKEPKQKKIDPITKMLAMKTKKVSKKPVSKRLEVGSHNMETDKVLTREKCGLSLEDTALSRHCLDQNMVLIEDEKLELRELSGENPPTCSDHCSWNGSYGCSLCNDFLPKFPPSSVKMKPPFSANSWDSSSETVKNLFKVLHFIYTYSVPLGVCNFTLDELSQSFHDKESLLLGRIHLALLHLLLSDIETEINRGEWPPLCVSCKYLALLHSVADRNVILRLWKSSLNPLTWTEILRQVLISAGYGSIRGSFRKKVQCKESRLTQKFGLSPKTLKGQLFRLLCEQGSKGCKVSDLSEHAKVTALELANTSEDLENLICSTLSSDITLFEKVSSSTYRIRFSALRKIDNDFKSSTEESESVNDSLNDGIYFSSDSECDSLTSGSSASKHTQLQQCRNELVVVDEIDESNPGETWLLGLMESEYSDLSSEEKLDALVAVIDLLSAGPSIRKEDPSRSLVESAFIPPLCGSGAKVKKLASKQNNFSRSWVYGRQHEEAQQYSSCSPIDSSRIYSHSFGFRQINESLCEERESYIHPMQSILLGSDRRYNRYWLFLGPCNKSDPGHKRIYFESSEDGHWEVIDTEETLRALLSVLDDRGVREAQLLESLESREAFLCEEMSMGRECAVPFGRPELRTVREYSSSPLSDVDNTLDLGDVSSDHRCHEGAIILAAGKQIDEFRKRRREQDYDSWIWNHFYCNLNAVKHYRKSYFDSLSKCEVCHDLYWRDEKHCRICHKTFELDFDLEERYAIHSATCRIGEAVGLPKHKLLSSPLQALKAAVHAIESAMPENSLLDRWNKCSHKIWAKRLRRTSSLQEVFQVVADFVAAINEDWLHQHNKNRCSDNFVDEIILCFPSMPQTSSSLALWLTKLDELLSPRQ